MKILISFLLAVFSFALAQEVNVYSARHYDSDTELFNAFTDASGIKVNLIEAKAEELIERVKSEGESSPADVIITVDAGNLWRAEQAGILVSIYSEKLLAVIPPNLRHPDSKWFGFATRARVIVYNKTTVTPDELSTYEDLATDIWKGRVCIRSSSNIYNQSLLASMIASLGIEAAENWAKGIVANMARDPEGGDTDQITAVAAGQCDVAIVNHYYLARMIAAAESEDDDDPIDPKAQEVVEKVGIFFPNQNDRGTHINISGAAVLENAPHKENAIKFLEFLASPEAQKLFAEQGFEYPVVAGVDASSVILDFGTFTSDSLNVASYGQYNPQAVQMMDRVGWK
jgi:iron(III) transport system substrate-binding protein